MPATTDAGFSMRWCPNRHQEGKDLELGRGDREHGFTDEPGQGCFDNYPRAGKDRFSLPTEEPMK